MKQRIMKQHTAEELDLIKNELKTEERRRKIAEQARGIVALDGSARTLSPRSEWLSEQVVLGLITNNEALEIILDDALLIKKGKLYT